jgi:hypothetical protein
MEEEVILSRRVSRMVLPALALNVIGFPNAATAAEPATTGLAGPREPGRGEEPGPKAIHPNSSTSTTVTTSKAANNGL